MLKFWFKSCFDVNKATQSYTFKSHRKDLRKISSHLFVQTQSQISTDERNWHIVQVEWSLNDIKVVLKTYDINFESVDLHIKVQRS
jgi:hypothetical protein